MTKDEELIERAANIAYRVCAETRHVTLGDKAANAIRAELRPADRLKALAQPVVGVAVAVPTETWHAVVDAASAYADFVAARESMNAAIPALDATPAERALYDERYKADHEAERKHWTTAIKLAQLAEQIVAASVDGAALAASPSPVVGDREALQEAHDAIDQALDDMGAQGHCVCPEAKDWLGSARTKAANALSTPGMGGEALALIKRVADGEWADPGHRALMNDARAYLAALSTPVTEAAQERCEYCGDTGDVHRSDGEWLGECTCGRAMPVSKD